jgi:PAS domain S-box-containing protein
MNQGKPDSIEHSFLAHGGEMGRLMRDKDWSDNILGTPDFWPQSLRTAVSIILNSKFPMFLFWGPELICFYNDAYRPSLGNEGKHPAILGSRGEDYWKEIWHIIKPLIDDVLANGIATWSEDQLIPIYRNGKLEDVYWTFSYSPVNDESGKPAGVFVTCNETTSKVLAHKKIEENEARLRMVIDSAEMGTWEYNFQTKKITASQRTSDLLGFEPRDINDIEKIITCIDKDEKDKILSSVNHQLVHGSEEHIDVEFLFKSVSGERYLRVMGKVIFNDGKLANILGTIIDVTSQQAAKSKLENTIRIRTNEIKQINKNLEERNRFVETIIDSSMDLIVVYDKEMRIISFNGACENLYKIKRGEVIGKNFLEVFPKARGGKGHLDLARALKGEPVHNLQYLSPVNNRYYENFLIPLINSEGEVYAVVVTAHDITNIIEARENVEQVNLRLEEKNKALLKSNYELEQFAYIASHDLQEPLRKIRTYISLILEDVIEENDRIQYLHKIDRSANHMSTLIKNVLEYSRLMQSEEKFIETDLNQVVEKVKSSFEFKIKQKNAVVNSNSLPVIKGIPYQLNQLFSNLMSNSLKFSGEQSVIEIHSVKKPMIDFDKHPALKGSKNYVEIIFRDNGIGFEPEYSEKIFTIFQRLNDRHAYEGTGIGLALCKRIVENHKGIIKAHSEPGKGATFNILLPVE